MCIVLVWIKADTVYSLVNDPRQIVGLTDAGDHEHDSEIKMYQYPVTVARSRLGLLLRFAQPIQTEQGGRFFFYTISARSLNFIACNIPDLQGEVV